MKTFKIFISAIIAGICIALGGVIFLSVDSKVVGAIFFTVGLFTICTFGFHLFTGKFCYVFDNDKHYALMTPIIWLGNLVGTGFIALIVSLTRNVTIREKAISLCTTKLDDNLLSLFLLGVVCNIFIFIAVDGFKNIEHQVGKYLALIFGVVGFILCGTEHCVADMFYFWMSGLITWKSLLCIVIISLGNCVGGVLIPLLRKVINLKTSK